MGTIIRPPHSHQAILPVIAIPGEPGKPYPVSIIQGAQGTRELPLVVYREPDDPGTSSEMPLTNEATIDPMVTTPINALNVPAIPTMPSSLINTIHEPRRTHL